MIQSAGSIGHTKDTTDLFILKHKDLDVAMMKMDVRTGMIEYVLSVYVPEELPVGCAPDGTGLGEWWKLHERLGWKNYVSYEMGTIHISGREYPCSLSPMFTSADTEFVSAYQIVAAYKVPNDVSLYEALIRQAVSLGADEKEVRAFLEYMILTDFILTNTDRHLNNFGFIYDPRQHRLSGMAPLFDTGNSLFYDCDVIPHGRHLLDIPVNSFSKREADQLHYVKSDAGVKLERLAHFPEEAEALLKEYTDMTEKRAAETARTIEEKIEYLNLFFQGKKIWKKERYW